MRPWHALSNDEVAQHFHVDVSRGLDDDAVVLNQRRYGLNVVEKKKEWRLLRLIRRQIENPLVIILIAAGIITFFILHDVADAAIIALAVLINTIIGVIQEGRASRAFDALVSTLEHQARVLRRGVLEEINSRELVPGDVIELEAGMSIEADARLFWAEHFRVNESMLSGEWIGQDKNIGILPVQVSMADRTNMVYAGTYVESGKARAVVVATGVSTTLGEIARTVEMSIETQTPFQKHLERISRLIGALVLFGAIMIFAVGVARGEKVSTMFLSAVAIAVSAVPEGLPVAITVILALGTERILKKGGLIKNLKSAETLGSTDVILMDKTGTLTEGVMTVSHVLPAVDSDSSKIDLLTCGVLTSSAFIENPKDELSNWRIRGESTERALLLAGINAGISKIDFENEYGLISFYPFDTENRFAAAVYQSQKNKEFLIAVSGAPEAIFDRAQMTATARKNFENEYTALASRGVRVVACAWRRVKKLPDEKNIFTKLTYLGCVGLHDPLRADVKDSLRIARSAGIRPVIVTGDHRLTATTIAHELGIASDDANIIEGSDIEKNITHIDDIAVFSRVLPHQKLSIVEAWHARGSIVAMTGDGVNDAPALRAADIGIALGSGTDVAKEASSLVLLNNSFTTIVAAIEEGRTIIDNIRKVVTFLLATVFTEFILVAGALLMGLPLPVVPAQILWMNLVGEGFFNFAFAFEKKEADAMKRSPHHSNSFFTGEMKALIFLVGMVSDFFLLGIFVILLRRGIPLDTVRTIVFTGLAVDAFFFVFSLRSLRRPIWEVNFFSNPYLLFAFVASIALLIPVFIFAPLRELLHIVPLAPWQFGIIAVLGVVDICFIEAVKYYFIRRQKTE